MCISGSFNTLCMEEGLEGYSAKRQICGVGYWYVYLNNLLITLCLHYICVCTYNLQKYINFCELSK